MTSRLLLLFVDGILLLAAGLFAYTDRIALALSIAAVTGLLLICQWVFLDTLDSTGQSVRVEFGVKRVHVIQVAVQICLYVYWALYWDEVARYAPLIVIQIVFAYAVEMLLSWMRYRAWRVGFGPVPIILSVNLFLWFKEEYFFLQLALIGLVYLGKDLVCWKREGRRVHIFNPSAFGLGIASIILLATGRLSVSYGVDIVETLGLPPNMFEVIFLLGLVSQFLYATTAITAGAVLSQYVLFNWAYQILGIPLSPSPINISVFLAFTLLVTDPSTSPRTTLGKFLFGVTYGAGTFFLCIALRFARQPSFVDKILMVPVVNLLVPMFDQIGDCGQRWVERVVGTPRWNLGRRPLLAVYVLLFVSILPALKVIYPRPERFPLPAPATGSSPAVTKLIRNKDYCHHYIPAPFRPFGFRSEIETYALLHEYYQHGVDESLLSREP